MLAWLKKFRRPVTPKEPSDLEIANATLAQALAKFDVAVEEYRVGMIKVYSQRADREQLERMGAGLQRAESLGGGGHAFDHG